MQSQKHQEIKKFHKNFPIRLVVSDFHLGLGRFLSDGTLNILEDFNCDEEFADFLQYYTTGSYENRPIELILNGDILNLLQVDDLGVHGHFITEKATIRAVKRIAEGHPLFFKALRDFASKPGLSIVYIVGNHDVGMVWKGPRDAFEKAVGSPVKFIEDFYQFDHIHIEHGHRYETFSRLDIENPILTQGLPEPVLNLPWGSIFVASWLTKMKLERPHIDKVKPIYSLIRWLLIHDTIWAVMSIFRMLKFIWETTILQSSHRIGVALHASWKMFQEMTVYPHFDDMAERVFQESPNTKVVIFGHTHVLRFRRFEGGKEYFNEGSWNDVTNLELGEFGKEAKLTYVLVEPSRSGARPTVRLKRWMGTWKPEMDLLG